MSNDVKTVGELLLAAREAQGLSIESIAKDICVRSSYLIAIEANNYKELPEKTFAVGFVRAYAMALKQDVKEIVTQFKQEFVGAEPAEVVVPDAAFKAPRRKLPGWLSPFAGVLGVAVCWAVFGGSVVPFSTTADSQVIDRNTDVAQLQAVQASLPATTEVAVESTKVEVTTPAARYLDAGSLFSPAAIAEQSDDGVAAHSDFTLKAMEDAWVRIANPDGTEVWSGVLREGQSYRPQLDGVALLSTTNAGGVSLSFGSQHLDTLGSRGEVVENVRLDEMRLFSASAAASSTATGSR